MGEPIFLCVISYVFHTIGDLVTAVAMFFQPLDQSTNFLGGHAFHFLSSLPMLSARFPLLQVYDNTPRANTQDGILHKDVNTLFVQIVHGNTPQSVV